MILIDKDIRSYVEQRQLVLSEFREENLNGASYDLRVDKVLGDDEKEMLECWLEPGAVVFVKTIEKISIPTNILGRIAEKNSRMRQGLKVDGPHYQPGHVTYAFLRVQNISNNSIKIQHNMKIAQIFFEQLTGIPEVPYSAQVGASFQNEVSFKGLGNYTKEYEKQTSRIIEKAKEDIESASQRIYGNVLSLMGIIVAIFSLITINYDAFVNATIDTKYIIAMNLTMSLCIVLMMGMILIFINKARHKGFLWAYIAIFAVLAIATIVFSVVVI